MSFMQQYISVTLPACHTYLGIYVIYHTKSNRLEQQLRHTAPYLVPPNFAVQIAHWPGEGTRRCIDTHRM